MVRTRLALLALLCLVVAPAVSPSAGAGSEDLAARLTKSLRSPYLALDRTGAIAVDTVTGEVLYEHNATLPLVPASNEKLPVAWTALILLGPGYRFHTDVVGRGERVGSTWDGDLFIAGDGDPTLTGATSDGSQRRFGLPASGASRVASGATSRRTTTAAERRAGSATSSGASRRRSPPSSSTALAAGPPSHRRSSPRERSATRSSRVASA